MKKTLSATFLTVLLLASAPQAQAQVVTHFGNDHLTQVFYTAASNTVEIGVDLGTIGTDFKLADSNKTLKTVDYASLVAGSGAAVGDLRLGMYIDSLVNRTDAVWDHYFVTTSATTPSTPGSSWYTAMDNATSAIAGYYSGSGVTKLDGGAVVKASPLDVSSYRTQMDGSGYVPGTYRTTSTFSPTNIQGELNLAAMAQNGYQDLYLWHYAYDLNGASTKVSHLLAGASTPYAAVLRFYSNGTTVLNPSAVPLPGAIWLAGSGLAAILASRRRQGMA